MEKFRQITGGLLIPLAALAVWQTLSSQAVLDPLFFPPPLVLASSAWSMMESGELGRQVLATLSRVGMGFLAGALAGLLCGLLMGTVTLARHAVEPMISALFTTPKLALFPMLMLVFGIGETPGLILIATGCFIVVALHTLDAVRGVNRAYLELAGNYGAGKMAIFRKVYLPASLPQIYTGLRLGAGRALTITIAIELVSAEDGLGGMIWIAWQSLTTDRLYVGVLATATMGMLFHMSLRYLEGRFIPWKKAEG